MKRALKIFGWTLFSLLMVILVAFGIACYILFTPSRLTPIVNRIVGNYVTCEYEIGRVELTLFSTFPRLGVRIDGLTVINPVEGAPSDTVLYAPTVTATVDVKQLLFSNTLVVPEAVLENAELNYFVAQDGTSNIDIFVTDSLETEEPDTAAFALPFDDLRVDGLRIQANKIAYNNEQDSIHATLGATTLAAYAENWNDMYLHLQSEDLYAVLGTETYADHIPMDFASPMHVQLDSMSFAFDQAHLTWDQFAMTLDGAVTLGDSLDIDMQLQTDGAWRIEPLLTTLPHSWVESIIEMKPKGDLSLTASVQGLIGDSVMPVVKITKLHSNLWNSKVDMTGVISDIESDMLLDIRMKMDLLIPDFKQFIPDDMQITGRTNGSAQITLRMSDLDKGVLTEGQVDLASDRLLVRMDTTLDAQLDLATIHAQGKQILAEKAAQYSLSLTGDIDAQYEDINAVMNGAHFDASLVGGKKIKAKLSADDLDARMGEEMSGTTGAITLVAASRYNPKGENMLLTWNPLVRINLVNGEFHAPDMLPDILYVPSIDFSYTNREMTINDSRIEIGNSDLNLQGEVRHIGRWMRKEGVLEGELNISSDHCDANQLLAWISDDNGSEEPEPEEEAPTINDQSSSTNDSVKAESSPFLVPTDVDLELHTHMREVEVFNQNAKDLKGGIYLRNGILVLDEVGFICKAAKLQLTAMYRTPRKNHLYVGFDYHMIDVDIDELLTMIPNLEDMVPMLSSFKGAAEFHLAAETYLKSNYDPKMSTLRGAASLTGKDLVVMDSETFDQISKLLLFKKKTENKIDSINAEITIYKNEIDVYPLCVQMDNYMVALGGRHNTNMTFNYDINVLKPIYLGVNVSGTFDDLSIKLAKCKFAEDFRPHWYQKVDNQSRELRERIKQSMEKNVRIK